ncbi:MAG: hypothetical protein L0287_01160 [Anaerolineae bacterium]|nr:hypothetical protein [Anaerolineae bacterium]MCI0607605.1 hypothetical protein [Anaerolineae bacterium]
MLSKNSYGSFDEYPKHEAELRLFRLSFPFIIEIIKRLLHGLAKLLSELMWIESKKLLVERVSRCLFIHGEIQEGDVAIFLLIAIRNV